MAVVLGIRPPICLLFGAIFYFLAQGKGGGGGGPDLHLDKWYLGGGGGLKV